MGRAIFGLIKGLIVGGGIGFCLWKLNNPGGVLVYLCCGIVGAVVGLLCGRAPWRAETIWTPILKVVFGLAVGAGLYALGHRFIPGGLAVSLQGVVDKLAFNSGAFLAPVIGGVYGLFVEVDDGGASAAQARLPARRPAKAALPELDKDL